MSILREERDREADRKAKVTVRSPNRRQTRDKLRAMAAPPVAKNCPDIFATDKEFMRLFRASKALEGNRKRKLEYLVLKNRLRARGIYLERQAKAELELAATTMLAMPAEDCING